MSFTALICLAGLAIGSFLNLCCDRLPQDRSLIRPSHCDACRHRLSPKDLIPILSYLWLKGRCRYCQSAISARNPVLELATGTGFALLAWHYEGAKLGVLLVYLSLFLLIFVIDLEHELILDKLTYPGMGLALAFSFLPSGVGIKSALLGGGVGLAFLIPFFFVRGMGGGDVKLGALLGLACGFPKVLVGLLLAMISGGLLAAVLLLSGRKQLRDLIPFGPFLASGAMAALIWGEQIWWYLSF